MTGDLSPWMDFLLTIGVAALLLALALGASAWLEQHGVTDDDDLYDEPPERNTHETPPKGDLLTVAQAAQALGVRRQRIYALISEGTLPSVTEHRHVYIPTEAVKRRLAEAALPERWMTVADVAAVFHTTTKTVYHWHQSGRLPGELLSRRRLRFDPAVVARFDRRAAVEAT